MKIRNGFVSNSSSTSFILYNKTKDVLPLTEFVAENEHLVDRYAEQYSFTLEDKSAEGRAAILAQMLENAKTESALQPGWNRFVFGDEDGTMLGRVYDYILRDGGKSDRFTWEYEESHR